MKMCDLVCYALWAHREVMSACHLLIRVLSVSFCFQTFGIILPHEKVEDQTMLEETFKNGRWD